MSLFFAIVGGGWYGCYIGVSFRALGLKVTIFEEKRPLWHRAINSSLRTLGHIISTTEVAHADA